MSVINSRPRFPIQVYIGFLDLWKGKMANSKSRRREWTKLDIRELKSLARAKTPAGRNARALKRTEGATRQKAFSLGVSLDSRG
jgi:hypothetical protein